MRAEIVVDGEGPVDVERESSVHRGVLGMVDLHAGWDGELVYWLEVAEGLGTVSGRRRVDSKSCSRGVITPGRNGNVVTEDM